MTQQHLLLKLGEVAVDYEFWHLVLVNSVKPNPEVAIEYQNAIHQSGKVLKELQEMQKLAVKLVMPQHSILKKN